MNQFIQAFAATREDYQSTVAEDHYFAPGRSELRLAFARQLLSTFWAMPKIRVFIALLLLVSFQFPNFVDSAVLFSIVTFYLVLPSSWLSRFFVAAKILVLSLFLWQSLDIKIPNLLIGIIATPTYLDFLFFTLLITGVLVLLLTAIRIYVSQSPQSSFSKIATVVFYLTSFTALIARACEADQLSIEWLSFGILAISFLRLFSIGAGRQAVSAVQMS